MSSLHVPALFAVSLALLSACASSGADPEDVRHVDAMAGEHADDVPVANAADRPPAQEVVAEEVVYGTVGGQPLTGYLARPEDAGDGELPAILVIHEWWGLNDNVRMMTRRLAGQGYQALAVDLYGGRVADAPERARELMMSVANDPEAAEENLRAAAEFLDEERDAESIGILGWCFGGGWSLRGALAMPEEIDAVVMYYGQPITDRDELEDLDAPLLGFFGAKDEGIPVARVREMERLLQDLGKDATILVYEGAGHAFANPSGHAYEPDAAEDAWERTIAFFAEHLER